MSAKSPPSAPASSSPSSIYSSPLPLSPCTSHRRVVQGDVSFGNGTGGESIWGKKFKDDQAGLKKKFTQRGDLAMGNVRRSAAL